MITAITFVALGTSMPDLFASKVAATGDPTADASIVNVTGSLFVTVVCTQGPGALLKKRVWAPGPLKKMDFAP